MTDYEMGVTVKGNVDDIESSLKQLDGQLGELKDVSIDISASSDGFTEVQEELKTLDETVVTPEVSSEGISQVKDEATGAKEEMEGLGDEADETSALIIGGMALASAAIFEVAGEAENAAQSLNDMSMSYWKLGSGWEGGESALRDQVATITDQRFPEEEATSYISLLKRLGVEQNDLISSSVELNKIRTATGASVEDMTPLLQAYKSMNIDLSNLETTYNAAYYANAKFVGGLPAYTTELRRYAAQFADLGLNADQAAVILVAAQNKWPDPRKRRQELAKAITESNGDLSLLEQKVGLTAGSIQNASDITGQYSGKVEDASKKSRELSTDTEKLGAWIDDLKTRFGGALGPILSFVGILGYLGAGIAGAWAALKAGMKLGDWKFDPAGEYIEKPLKNATSRLKDWISTVKDWMNWGKQATQTSEEFGIKLYENVGKSERAGGAVSESVGRGFQTGASKSSVLIDESGRVLWTDTDDVIRNLNKLVPSAEETGLAIPTRFGSSLLRGASRAVGDIASFGVILIDALANQLEFLKDPSGFIFGPIADVFILPKQFREALSPLKILRQVVGEDQYAMFENAVKTYIEDPMKRALGDTWNDVTGWFNGLTGGMFKEVGAQSTEAGAVVQGTIKTTEEIAKNASQLMKTQGVASFQAQAQAAQEYAEKVKTAYEEAKAAAADAMSFFQSSLSSLGVSMPGAQGNSYQTLQDLYDARRAARTELNNLGKMHDEGLISDQAYSTQKRKLKELIDQLNDPALFRSIAQSGQSVGQTWGAGLATGITTSQQNINNAIANASKGLIANSPPVEGPLMNIDKDGLNIATIFTDNIAKGLEGANGVLNTGLATIGLGDVPSMQTPTTNSTKMEITVSLAGANIASNLDATTVGQRVGDGLASKLLGQASNAGVNVVNIQR